VVPKRPIGRPKTRWEDDVLEDIKSMNICNWKKVAQNRDSWKKAVKQARTLYVYMQVVAHYKIIFQLHNQWAKQPEKPTTAEN
jgi:5-bromo-4-chloroindolyl phosphate hydrolysis protein